MSGLYPQEVIDRVKESVDIVDIISSYIPVRKSGANMSALCPFHQEKTPSFSISPSKQIFHCFGCGEGGNVISFVMKYENLAFPEAIRLVAEKGGVKLPKISQEPSEDFASLYAVNRDAANFFYTRLRDASGAEALAYLEKRGLSKETLEKFALGFAPDSWDECLKFLRSKKHSEKDILKAGLIKPSSSGNNIDTFRGRIIFPIVDEKNRVIAFGGRSLSNDSKGPKYLNSQETPVYRKGRIFYGLNLSGEHIRNKNLALIVEGYMDLIALNQAGIDNVVATSGTAFTEYQARALKRFTSNFVMIFDGDVAGRNAAERATRIAIEQGVRPKIAMLDASTDPDDMVKKGGAESINELIKSAKPFISYLIEITIQKHDISTPEGKSDAVKALIPEIAKIGEPIERSGAVQVLSGKLGIPPERIESLLPGYSLGRGQKRVSSSGKEPAHPFEKIIIRIILDHPEVLGAKLFAIKAEDFISPSCGRIFSILSELIGKGAVNSGELLENMEDAELKERLRGLAMETGVYDEERVDQNVGEFLKYIESRKQKQIRDEMLRAAREDKRDIFLDREKEFRRLH